jgi:hypothetical protein
MSGINEWLADYYGTDMTKEASFDEETSTDDLELWGLFKAAAAEDGIDVDHLSDEDVDALAAHYLNDEASASAEEEGGDLPPNWDGDDVDNYNNLDDTEKTAFVQFKEAEFLGQVMAHSMFSEMDKMAKAPAFIEAGATKGKELLQSAGRALSSAGRAEKLRGGHAAVGEGRVAGTKAEGSRKLWASKAQEAAAKSKSGRATAAQRKAQSGASAAASRRDAAAESVAAGKKLRLRGAAETAGLYGGGLGAVGGTGYALGKNADAIEAIAEQRALNFLKEAGVEFEDDTDAVIDQRAVEMLIENGYGELLA